MDVAADSCSRSQRRRRAAARDARRLERHLVEVLSLRISSAAIEGLTFPASGAEYWAFWLNDAPAAAGICSLDPKPGDSILFFPDCYGKSCPKNAGVLGRQGAPVGCAGKPVHGAP